MPNRLYQQYRWGFLRNIVALYPVVTVGAAGAVTLKTRSLTAAGSGSAAPAFSLASSPTSGTGYAYSNRDGVRKVVRNAAGDWTFTLSDSYLFLVGINLLGVSNTTGHITSPLAPIGIISGGTNVQTNTAIGDGGTIEIFLPDSAGTSGTDPADGDTLYFQILLGTSTAT